MTAETVIILKIMERRAQGAAALLATGLAVAWMFGVGYHATSWLGWTVVAAAIVAYGSLGTIRTTEVQGFATWPLVSLVLFAGWLFGLATSATAWLTWIAFAGGCGFLLLTMGFLIGTAHMPPLHRHGLRHGLHGRA